MEPPPLGDQTRQKPFRELMSSDKMVKIFVGAEKQMFCLHLDLICDRVPYFKAAFTSGFKETIDMAMTMEEEEPAVFALLVEWIYSDKGKYQYTCDNCISKDSLLQEEHTRPTLLLYILADKLGLPRLSEQAADRYLMCLDNFEWLPCAPEIKLVFENTTEYSPLRREIVYRMTKRFFQARRIMNADEWLDTIEVSKDFNTEYIASIISHKALDYKECEWARRFECTVHHYAYVVSERVAARLGTSVIPPRFGR